MATTIKDLAISFRDIGDGGPLPYAHAHDQADTSPALIISGVPAEAVELALVCHDPDAPRPYGFTHWTVYGIPPTTTVIEHGDSATFRDGPTDFGSPGYGGPLPPLGHGEHRYYFWVYAMRRPVQGAPSFQEFLSAHADDIIEQNRVVGTYQR